MPAPIAEALPFASDRRFALGAFKRHISVSYILTAKANSNENPGFVEAISDRLFRRRARHETLGLYARSMIAAGKIKSKKPPE